MSFVHLHTHSEYSLLDGLSRIDDLLAKCKKYEMPALALTDHGNLHGAIEFYKKAKKAGIKPIIGMEGYLAKRSRYDKEARVDVEPFHITLIAKNNQGYQHLIKLSTKGHLEGFYYKPRLDRQLLRKYAEGLICLSGCVNGEIARAIADGQMNLARELIKEYADIFGSNNFYLELQNHEKVPYIWEISQKLLNLAQEFNLPVVATNDVHYVEKDDAFAQDALLALQTKQTVQTPNRKLTMIDSPTFYLKTPEEMKALFYAFPESLQNTLRIAQLCDVEIPLNQLIFPEFQVPSGQTPENYLKNLTWQGAYEKLGELSSEAEKRLNYELEVLISEGYATYILIFADLAKFCQERKIFTNTRGSAAGSLVLYALGVTNLNPLKYQIPFERFLYKGRASPPDIDYDIADDRREEIISYVKQKYGEEHVTQIVTFGRMEARAAVRDSTRVLGHPYSLGDRIAKMIPIGPQGFHTQLEEVIEQVLELKEHYQSDEIARQIVDLATKLQGVARHASTHAAGVIITDKPITNYVPLMRDSKANKIMTQYDMYTTDLNVSPEALGLLKLDFLGLRNLSTLALTIDLVKKNHDIEIDIQKIPLDESRVFEMIGKGDTTGIFQLESSGMRRVARDLKPNRVEDLMVMVALFRPGPMDLINQYIEGKHHPEQIHYIHPALKEILAPTYGVLVYQDQCLTIATKMAGMDDRQADALRRAIGKKKKGLMEEQKKRFIEGAKKQGYTQKEAQEVFSFIEKFAAYGFNQGHSASYGMLVYQTAYMKALYPVEYLCAILTCEVGNQDKVSLVINECRRMGLSILPPDINKSEVSFQIEEGGIRFGLSAIKNVGASAVEKIIQERELRGPFISLADFCRRVDLFSSNKKVMESLIRCGAMNCLGPRAAQLRALPELMETGAAYQRQRARGQAGLFDLGEKRVERSLPQVPEFPKETLLAFEKELLGYYLSEDPHQEIFAKVTKYISHEIGEITEAEVGKMATVGGIITDIRKILTRRDSQEMAFMKVTDQTGTIEAIVFPKIFQNGKRHLQTDQLILVQGRIDNKDEKDLKIIAEKLLVPNNNH